MRGKGQDAIIDEEKRDMFSVRLFRNHEKSKVSKFALMPYPIKLDCDETELFKGFERVLKEYPRQCWNYTESILKQPYVFKTRNRERFMKTVLKLQQERCSSGDQNKADFYYPKFPKHTIPSHWNGVCIFHVKDNPDTTNKSDIIV